MCALTRPLVHATASVEGLLGAAERRAGGISFAASKASAGSSDVGLMRLSRDGGRGWGPRAQEELEGVAGT